jgi:hypothetical protein
LIDIIKGLLYNLEIYKNHLASITKDDEKIIGFEKIYQELVNSGEVDPDIFMEKIQ